MAKKYRKKTYCQSCIYQQRIINKLEERIKEKLEARLENKP